MAFNFKEKMQGLMDKLTARREEGQRPPLSTMPNGSISGYQPRVSRRGAAQETQAQDVHPAAAFAGMAPAGVNPTAMPQFMPPLQPTARQPMQGRQPFGGQAPRQPYGNQASSQPLPPPQQPMNGTMRQPVQPMNGTVRQPMPPMNGPAQQPVSNGGYQPRHQNVSQQTGWNGGFTQQQPAPQQAQPAPQAAQQPPVQNNVQYFPGTVEDEEGNPYSMTLRVAQITGIASCYRLLEFMQNNEAVIVNAEQITDVVEANRCMDMLFGAAYAMNQNFERIAGKLIYLIAPRHVHVLPFESMLHLSQQDIERRWPGSSRSGGQEPRRAAYRQEDFAPAFGQRAAAPQPARYSEFGGFSHRG